MNILITGALGWLGKALTETLGRAHAVTAFDLESPDAPREDLDLSSSASCDGLRSVSVRYGDVTEFDSVSAAMAGQDAVVHAAIASTVTRGLYRADDPAPFAVNVRGAYNVLEAARRNGVRRAALVASAETHVSHPPGRFIDHASFYRGAGSIYDLTKALQEEVARWFCDLHGMNVSVLRLGDILDLGAGAAKAIGLEEDASDDAKVQARGEETWQESMNTNSWIDRYDVARACLKALESDQQGFNVFHAVAAAEARGRFDVDRTERVLGIRFRRDFDLRPASQRTPT